MIHVCFGLYDKNGTYSKFTGTTMLSVFENTNLPVTIHILHDNTLTQDNHEKFIYIAGRYNQLVKFYNVDELCADKIEKFVSLAPEIEGWRITRGALYRLVLPQLLSDIEKIIYLDSDIIVNLDIKELWQLDLGEKILAAVPEILFHKTVDVMKDFFRLCKDGLVKPEDYFNSGVLVMNLNLLRGEEKTILDGFRFRAKNSRYIDYFDQNVLNYCFSTKTLKLPAKFNRPSQCVRLEKEPLAKKIYHYASGSFGLGLTLDMSDALNQLWLKYFVQTPWFNEKIIARLYEKFFQAQAALKKSALKLSAAVSGKSRVFVTTEEQLNLLVENFFVKADEEVIVIKPDTPIQKLIDAMKALRGQKIFFFLLGGFPFNKLEKAGFVRGKDFVDGFKFSPNFNSYPFVAAL